MPSDLWKLSCFTITLKYLEFSLSWQMSDVFLFLIANLSYSSVSTSSSTKSIFSFSSSYFSFSLEIKKPRAMTVNRLPMRGATQKIQWSSQRSSAPLREATTAGPKERVGLIEHPVIGIFTTWATNTASPMAIGAQLPATPFLFTAVSKTTQVKRAVMSSSARNALPQANLGLRVLAPNELVKSVLKLVSLSFSVVPRSNNAPRTDPII
mmetsp:Transcript_3267/g.4783  ORF Transcript_3267/g.4783 Transcript_3267/m.4783 type:complete len:209 (-) Transcript_3267:202-828(-)